MKKIDLFIGHLGNGATCCDKSREKNGDYLKVAHIQENGQVTFYEPLFDEDKNQIKAYAWQCFGEKFQIMKFIHEVYPKHSYHELKEEISKDLLIDRMTRTHKSLTYQILIYKHAYSRELYEKDLFFTYTIKRKG